MKKKLFLRKLQCLLATAIALFISSVSYGQGLLVKGSVTDSSGKALENVTVKVKGSSKGTTTAADGSFSITVPSSGSVLTFSSVGFIAKEVHAGANPIRISLAQLHETMGDVIVVGYTQQSKTKITAAISKLDPDEMKNTSNPNPVQAIQGKIAGVSVPIVTGQPGSGANNIIIRGGTKLNEYGTGLGNSGGNPNSGVESSTPLVIVDGIFRAMDDINPDDIESFQVMKDAASTAIYGARGANGVIVIKTKGGKFNSRPHVTANFRNNWETQARKYNYLSAKDYLVLARTTVKNTTDPIDKNNLLNNGGFSAGTTVFTAKGQYGNSINLTALYDNVVAIEGQPYVDNLLSKGWQTIDDPVNPGTKLLFDDNHYQDLIWKTGNTRNYNVAVDGGSDKANYNVSMGYVDQAGVFVGTKYQRYNALGNFGFKVSDNFRLNAMLNYQNVLPNYVDAYQNDLTRGTRLTPLIRIFKDNGDPTTGEVLTARNRFHTLKYDDTRVSTERLASRLDADITIVKGLHYRPAVAYLLQDYRYLFFRKAFPDPIQFATSRQKTENTNNYRELMVDQILQYDYTLHNDHHFMLLGGFNYTRETNSLINIGSQRATNDYIFTINEPSVTTINGQTVTNVTDFSTSLTETRSASYFGQLNYDYQGKYLVSGAIRYDGFSNFAPENKYALFPSVSAGWNIHNEKFWNVRPVSSLKLRASWGQAGSRDLNLTDTYGSYTATAYAQSPGILRANLSNPNLKWELTETTDLAFDAGFLNDRLTLTVDYYDKLTKNRLASEPLPSEAPFSTITYNNGTLQNKGVEVEIGAMIIKHTSFTWKTNFSFAYNRQMIMKLPANGRARNRQGGITVYDPKSKTEKDAGGYAQGERPFGLWAYKVDGVFSTDAEAAAWGKVDQLASPSGIPIGKHAGDYKWADLNNDGIIDTRDVVFMGYSTPDKIGGMQNTLTYKNFTLRVAVDYAMGFVISNGALARSLGQGRAFNEGAPAEALGKDIWQKSGDVGKKYARFSFADFDYGQRNYLRTSAIGTNNSYGSDVSTMISKGDFLALREIYIGYDIPKAVLKKIHASNLNVFGSIYNLAYLTAYKGLNPETYSGFDDGGYPRPRQFSLGATLKF